MSPVRSWVYVLCLDPPRGIGEGDVAPDAVISHYVGWTQQNWPMHRAGSHRGAGMATCVLLVPGTLADEERLKTRGRCPRCGRSLNYRAEAARAARAARAAARKRAAEPADTGVADG